MGVAGLQACQVISALMRWPENFYHRTTGDAATNTPSFPYSHSTYLAKEKKNTCTFSTVSSCTRQHRTLPPQPDMASTQHAVQVAALTRNVRIFKKGIPIFA